MEASISISAMLPDYWVKLFLARQKDLKLSRNIEMQFNRFASIILDQTAEKPVLRE